MLFYLPLPLFNGLFNQGEGIIHQFTCGHVIHFQRGSERHRTFDFIECFLNKSLDCFETFNHKPQRWKLAAAVADELI